MLNVLVYVKKHFQTRRQRRDEIGLDRLKSYFRAQIDNSLRFGWRKEQIVIGTNFFLNYRGVSSVILDDSCDKNRFFNKFYGLRELLRKGYLETDVWYHDQDSFQVAKFEFPEGDGSIGLSRYTVREGFNTANMYVRRQGLPYVERIADLMDKWSMEEIGREFPNIPIRAITDEEFLLLCAKRETDIQSSVYELNSRYSMGLTGFDSRYTAAQKPIIAIGFKPHIRKDRAIFQGKNAHRINLVDQELEEILKKNKILARRYCGFG